MTPKGRKLGELEVRELVVGQQAGPDQEARALGAPRVRRGAYTRLQYTFPGRVPAGPSRSFVIGYSGRQWHGQVV
jgi:hypothetical protein